MVFRKGDRILDNMLEESRNKFTDHDPLLRRQGLERLWDAWELVPGVSATNEEKDSM